jgi:rhodanese-related sulfurtransferase
MAGLELYAGVNVVSKAFGEFIETTYDTPRITAMELKTKIDSNERLFIFDARPKEEYQRMSIPGAINVPGAELVHRFFDLVPDADIQVVVNCAGRTRSIIGAQSLINAGVPNPVVALKNGTMGWHLAGFDLEYGKDRNTPSPLLDNVKAAKAHTAKVAERFGVKRVGYDTLKIWRRESEYRTLYILDVRLPEEFEQGHLVGSRNAPGGQLIQATDEFVVTRNARMVLVDDNEIRATMTASWLIQMGWNDVFVLSGGIGNKKLTHGLHTPAIAGFKKETTISPFELDRILNSGESIAVIDFATSRQYKERHVPGAVWCVRSRIPVDLEQIPDAKRFVLTSLNGILAHIAVKDVRAVRPDAVVKVLKGGTDAWFHAKLPIENGMTFALSPENDIWYKPYEQKDAPEKAMQDYLEWEIALVKQIKKDDTIPFRTYF